MRNEYSSNRERTRMKIEKTERLRPYGVGQKNTLASTLSAHGVDCEKVRHVGGGYLHSLTDDSPYEVDGIVYCGRCHKYLHAISEVRQA